MDVPFQKKIMFDCLYIFLKLRQLLLSLTVFASMVTTTTMATIVTMVTTFQ
jgi:hypothetical protein